jgi:hypothetical protein
VLAIVKPETKILRAALVSSALFWNELAIPEHGDHQDLFVRPNVISVRERIADGLGMFAEVVGGAPGRKILTADPFAVPLEPGDLRASNYLHTSIAGYRNIRAAINGLSARAQNVAIQNCRKPVNDAARKLHWLSVGSVVCVDRDPQSR